ncbi:MAG: T9SS type A sorting domain-containing protein [Bacteroidales bacterium]|nr:T9SS type A sorting domain-containing protein [Bacteroidales bacterium]
MKTKTTLKIFIAAMLISLFAAKTNAQIVYTELNPYVLIEDTILSDSEPECYMLDLNNDGPIEFEICIYWGIQFPGPSFRILRITQIDLINNIIVDENNPSHALYLILNDTIKEESTWSINSAIICGYAPGLYRPCPMGDLYFGLKFYNDNNIHYGWVRLEATWEQAIIKDYAYNATPNAPILAGQTSLNIQNIQQNYLNVFVQNKVLLINFNNNLLPNGTVKVLNTNGTAVLNNQITQGNNQINLSHLTAGIYFVNIESTYGIYNKKIFIQ